MEFFVEQLARIAPLREGLEIRSAVETTWAISSVEVFRLLTVDLAWTEEQFMDWLEDSLRRLLLP